MTDYQAPHDPTADPSPQPTNPDQGGAGLKVGVAVAAVVVLVLAVGLAIVLRGRSADDVRAANAVAASSTHASSTTGTVPGTGLNIGDEVRSIPDPEHPGQTITLGGPTTTTTTPRATTTPPTQAPPTAPPTTAAPTTTTAAPTATSTTTPDTTVKIGSFDLPKTVDCHVPANVPNQIKLSWNAPNAVKVTISVDGGPDAIFDTHMGSTGSSMYPWSCPGPHTYTITAYAADNNRIFKTVTVTGTP